MCVGVPCKVLEILDGDMAVVEVGGARRAVNLHLLDTVLPGEYVLVHAGFAISKLEESEAQETLLMLEAYFGGSLVDEDPVSGTTTP
jgi:hydrogenase expression/formation protein HypC